MEKNRYQFTQYLFIQVWNCKTPESWKNNKIKIGGFYWKLYLHLYLYLYLFIFSCPRLGLNEAEAKLTSCENSYLRVWYSFFKVKHWNGMKDEMKKMRGVYAVGKLFRSNYYWIVLNVPLEFQNDVAVMAAGGDFRWPTRVNRMPVVPYYSWKFT